MVVLNRIYTRTGDDGTTSLGSGARRKKYDLRVDAYGTLDEVNAVLGLVRLHTAGDPTLDAALGRIQNDLFDVEADLCLSEKGPGGARLTVTEAQVKWLEGEIDRLNEGLAPLKSFILPGGSAASAWLHLARTVCRRAERIMVALMDQPGEEVSAPSLPYSLRPEPRGRQYVQSVCRIYRLGGWRNPNEAGTRKRIRKGLSGAAPERLPAGLRRPTASARRQALLAPMRRPREHR